MSTWLQISALPDDYQQRIFAIYDSSQFLPLSIRKSLASWIESQDWSFFVDPNAVFDSTFFQQCYHLLQQFIDQLEMLSAATGDRNDAFQIAVCLSSLQRSLDTADFEIIRHIDDNLRAESAIIKHYQESLTAGSNVNSQNGELENVCLRIHQKLLYTESLLNGQAQTVSGSIELYSEILAKHLQLIGQLEATSSILITDLASWKSTRKSTTYNSYSEFYQGTKQCQDLAGSLLLLWKQLKKVKNFVKGYQLVDCQMMKARVATQLKGLITATFLIDQQPYQVIKTNLKLKRIVVNCLVGNLFAEQTATLPTVKVNLINERQAKQLFMSDVDDFPASTTSGEIIHNSAFMVPKSSNILSAYFAQMQVKKVQRNTEKKRKPTDLVLDEKLAFLFISEFVLDDELRIGVKVLSEPIVVIVNAYQEAHAQATILWDNAFAERNRSPFDVPQEVPFSQLVHILSQKFLEHAGRSLTDDNIHFLAEKLLGDYCTDPLQCCISFRQFAREHIRSLPFTFWEWFNAALKLTNDHLRDLWYENKIIGFISRRRAEDLLLGQPAGTFLLRFSDSRLGCISIALVTSEQSVMMVEPFSASDLKMRSLADRLRDFDQLLFLYPGIPKEVAFSRFYSQNSPSLPIQDGYVLPLQLNFIANAS